MKRWFGTQRVERHDKSNKGTAVSGVSSWRSIQVCNFLEASFDVLGDGIGGMTSCTRQGRCTDSVRTICYLGRMLTREIQLDTEGAPVTLNPRWLRIPAAVKYSGLSRCEPPFGAKLTCGICFDSVGQQQDISAISLPLRMPISQVSLSLSMGQHQTHTRKISDRKPTNS